MKLQLKVKEEECEGGCPLPLNVLVGMKRAITKVECDEEKGTDIIEFDEKAISKKEILSTIKKMHYHVVGVKNGY